MSNSPNYIGVTFHALDAKNRLAIPSKIRFGIKNHRGMILSCGLEGCLNLYEQEAWKRIGEKLEAMPLKNKSEQRAFKRMLFASAGEVEFDDEGRILIPQALAAYANLRREAAILGLGEKIEIWAKHRWAQYERKEKGSFQRYASQLEI